MKKSLINIVVVLWLISNNNVTDFSTDYRPKSTNNNSEIPGNISMIKIIDDEIYIGGMNYLGKYKLNHKNELKKIILEFYNNQSIMSGSDVGFKYQFNKKVKNLPNNPESMVFDTCLNWKGEHSNDSVRKTAFDYQHWNYYTPTGNWELMNYTCMNSFIKSVEKIDNDTLWVCGTFGAFPRAFSVHKKNLSFIRFVDNNMMSCSRYLDEPMATYTDKLKNLYVASGWGLYRPSKTNPDVPNNNSTMLYADWRLYRNLFTLPNSMAWVLSSDVNFINVVKETDTHLYFFGREINNQYGLNNQEDRYAWQSFMLRICKNDSGFKYAPNDLADITKHSVSKNYQSGKINGELHDLSPPPDEASHKKDWYENIVHLPTQHFVTSQKLNYGCYLGKRPRSISDNHFWGQTNVVYFNQQVDVIFDPSRKIKISIKNNNEYFGCSNEPHSLIPLIGLFNREGLVHTATEPSGALCQLHINENIFNEIGSNKSVYHKTNSVNASNAYDEIMLLSSTSYSNFYSRTIHRTNGVTLYPYWNQGVLIGENKEFRNDYQNAFDDIGKCQNESFYDNMNKEKFLKIQNFSNTAWPNELPNRLTSIASAICQFSAVELYSFNASFILEKVEFKKIFLVKDNITNYAKNPILNQNISTEEERNYPVIIVNILSTAGHLYRVVLCDFDNGMINHGINKTLNKWYNWCIFRHTDQPYLYRQYAPMESRERGDLYQYRASSLLLDKKIVSDSDESSYPINQDPQFHVVKDVVKKNDTLIIVTTNNYYVESININCSATYATCIECASDPECMWGTTKNECIKYNKNKYNNETFVQDVLDRGFKCAYFLKSINRSINLRNKLPIVIRCENIGFWRGKFEWEIDDKIVKENKTKYLLHPKNHYLILLENDNANKISCFGVKDDHDKLYNNKEYEWINDTYSRMVLSTFTHEDTSNNCVTRKDFCDTSNNYVIWVAFFVSGFIIGALCAWFCYYCKNRNNESRAEPRLGMSLLSERGVPT